MSERLGKNGALLVLFSKKGGQGLLSGSVSAFSGVESECVVAAPALTKRLWGFAGIGDQLEKCFCAFGGWLCSSR